MTPVVTSAAPRRGASRRTILGGVAVGLAMAALLAVSTRQGLPDQVDEIAVDNPFPWIAHVSVSGAAGDRRLGLGTVPPESRRRFHLVADQGEVWVFTFAHAGVRVEATVEREQLEDDGWTVTVPPEFGARLAEAQLPESAPGAG